MIRWLSNRRHGPIGVDIGSRCIKMVQFDGNRSRIIDAARGDLPPLAENPTPANQATRISETIERTLRGRNFRGRDAVLCLNDEHLLIQNLRVPRAEGVELDRLVAQEAAGKIPFPVAEAELRYFEAADVRQGEKTLREVILLACHRPKLNELLELVDQGGLHPVAVDVEPAALVRSYAGQYRRDEDRDQRALLVHLGYSYSMVTITQRDEVLFTKYVEVGGKHFDEAVARHLKMDLSQAVNLRRHNNDRRLEQRDPEIQRSLQEALRPATDRLIAEISLCVRYHSVTFRGQPLVRMVLSGGEATTALQDQIASHFDFRCEVSDPLRAFAVPADLGRRSQWDVAAGLALRDVD